MGKDGEARVLQGDQAHQHVVGRRLLLLVDPGGLVAVVAVGDQQLGLLERGLERRDRVLVFDAPELVERALVVGDLAPRGVVRERLDGGPSGVGGVVVEAEDRGGFARVARVRRSRSPSGPGACARADGPRPGP